MEHKDRQDKIERDELELAEFERELRRAMQHRPAPMGLKQRVLARARERKHSRRGRVWLFQRVTASLALAAAIGGFAVYHRVEERRAEEERKGEEARQQVLTALHITNKALTRVSDKLTDRD